MHPIGLQSRETAFLELHTGLDFETVEHGNSLSRKQVERAGTEASPHSTLYSIRYDSDPRPLPMHRIRVQSNQV